MNILIATFLTHNSPSGVVTYYQTLARDLRERGNHVQIVETTDTPYVWNKSLNLLGYVFKRLGRTSRVLWQESSYFVRLYLGVRQHRHQSFDIIHAQDVRSGVAAFYALGRRVPVVVTAHFNDDPVTEWTSTGALPDSISRLLTRWYRWLFAQVPNYVFVSRYAVERSRHLLPSETNRIILPNTVTIEQHEGKARASQPINKPLIISNVGYVDERKNQELLIRMAAELRQKGQDSFQVWLIGDGPKRAEYEQLTAALGLGQEVRFWGRQVQPWRLVAQSDLYVHTALNDNCPYALLEAFAVQVPVLALAVGGIPELLPHGAGLFTETNPASLAEKILIYTDRQQWASLRAIQTRYAQEHLSHETNLKKLLTFYDHCRHSHHKQRLPSVQHPVEKQTRSDNSMVSPSTPQPVSTPS